MNLVIINRKHLVRVQILLFINETEKDLMCSFHSISISIGNLLFYSFQTVSITVKPNPKSVNHSIVLK
jgi:hypothetical protein